MLFPEKATAFIKRQIKLEQFYINLKHLRTSRSSLNVPIPDLALPKAIPSLAVFAWKPFSGTANCSCLRHHAVWAIACHFVGFPEGNNYSRGIGDAWHPSKTKVGSRHNHQTSPETGKNYQEPMKSKHVPFPLIPTMAKENSLDCSEGNMEEIGGTTQGSDNFQERARLSAILWAF